MSRQPGRSEEAPEKRESVLRPTRPLVGSWLVASVLLAATASPAGAQMMNGMGSRMMGPETQHSVMGNNSSPASGAAPQQYSGADAREFGRVCSSCHALPNPLLHTASQWPRVVARMEGYMGSSSMPVPDRRTLQDVEHYLEAHAAKP